MILYSDKNVLQAANDRIRKIFGYGRPVVVSFSGGKDSTVLLEITLQVAKELGISKVPVLFLDQECEYTRTAEYMQYIMNRPEVEPYWMQIPFRLWNANTGDWFTPWEPGVKWMREKEGIAYKENIYKCDRFKELFDAICHYHFGKGYISLGGVRIEESITRRRGLMSGNVIDGITWGKKGNNGIVLYPLFDWSFKDIWYYIFSTRVKYNTVYNYIFTKKPLSRARVSSLIHENSNEAIPLLQEIDPVAYNAMYERIPNIGTTNHLLLDAFEEIKNYPNCFVSWSEYIRYLIDNLICDANKVTFHRNFDRVELEIRGWQKRDKIDIYRTFCRGIITEDFEMTKLANGIQRHKHNYKYGNIETVIEE